MNSSNDNNTKRSASNQHDSGLVSNKMLVGMMFTLLVLLSGWLVSAIAQNLGKIENTAVEARDVAKSADQRSKDNKETIDTVIHRLDNSIQTMAGVSSVQREINVKLQILLDDKKINGKNN